MSGATLRPRAAHPATAGETSFLRRLLSKMQPFAPERSGKDSPAKPSAEILRVPDLLDLLSRADEIGRVIERADYRRAPLAVGYQDTVHLIGDCGMLVMAGGQWDALYAAGTLSHCGAITPAGRATLAAQK